MAKRLTNRLATLSAAACLLGSLAPVALAQNTPVGTWDVVLSEGQRGVARISFVDGGAGGGTLVGSEVFAYRTHNVADPNEIDPRTPGGDSGRTPDGSGGGSTNLFGYADIVGTWAYDNKGKVVGAWWELARNRTNGISFKATVKPGVRITMHGTRWAGLPYDLPGGHNVSYRGIPLTNQVDLTGQSMYAVGHRNGISVTETFTLQPMPATIDDPFPNKYTAGGNGPGYVYTDSIVYVSGLKYIAFYSETSERTNGLVRTVAGSFNLKSLRGSLIGAAEDPNPIPGPAQKFGLKISPPGL